MSRVWTTALFIGFFSVFNSQLLAAPKPDRLRVGVGAQNLSMGAMLDHSSFGHEGADSFEVGPEGNTNLTAGFRIFTEPYGAQLGWDARGLRSRTEFDVTIQTFNVFSNSFLIGGHFVLFTFGLDSPHGNHVYLAEVEYFSPYLDGGATNFTVDVRKLAGGDDTPFTGSQLLPPVVLDPGTNTVGRMRVFFGPVRAATSQSVVRGTNALTVNFTAQRGGRYLASLFRRRADGTLKLFQKKTVFAPLPLFGEPLDSVGPASVTFTGNIPANREVVRIVAQ